MEEAAESALSRASTDNNEGAANMGFMPGIFSRDKYFERLDELLNRHPAQCLEALRTAEASQDTANEDERSVYEIAVDVNNGLVPNDEPARKALDATAIDRVKTFWYTKKAGQLYFDLDTAVYTPAVRRQISRLAFIRALEIAGKTGAQIRSHYLCVGDHFEGVVNGMDPNDPIVQVVLVTGKLRKNIEVPDILFNDSENVFICGLRERIDATKNRTPRPETVPGQRPHKTDTTWNDDDTDIVLAKGGAVGMIRPRRES